MIDNITHKTILLFCPNFYDYDIQMRAALLRMGAKEVLLYDSPIYKGDLLSVGINVHSLYWKLRTPNERKEYTQQIIYNIKGKHIDVMLCIQDISFSMRFIPYLKEHNANIKTILFLWDVVRERKGDFRDYFKQFDKVFSFDRDDARLLSCQYFPDFYLYDTTKQLHFKYDMSFFGTLNNIQVANRPKVLRYLTAFSKEHNLNTFFFLKYGLPERPKTRIKRFKQIMRPQSKVNKTALNYVNDNFMHLHSMPLKEVENIQQQTKVFVDLSHSNRQGFTLNAISALAKGRKLITTNKRIEEEDFFNENNIYIIDEDEPHIDISFFDTPIIDYDFTYLRLDNWLRNLIND